MREEHCDVAIVGARLAGLRLAANLSDKGFRVMVFEARPDFDHGSFWVVVPRRLCEEAGLRAQEYVPCQGYLTYSLHHVQTFNYPQPRDCFTHIGALARGYRDRLGDAELLLHHRVSRIDLKDHRVRLQVMAPSGPLQVSCRLLALCDGVRSISDRTFGGPGHVRGLEYHLEGVEGRAGYFEAFHTHRYSPGLYVAILNLSDREVVVEIGTTEADAARRLRTFLNDHPMARERGLARGRLVAAHGGITAIGRRSRQVEGRLIFVGDAGAGYPWLGGLTCEGAVQCADVASPFIAEALRQPGDAALVQALEGYEAAWEAAFGRRFHFEAELRQAFSRLSDEEVDEVFARLASSTGGGLRRAIIDRARSNVQATLQERV